MPIKYWEYQHKIWTYVTIINVDECKNKRKRIGREIIKMRRKTSTMTGINEIFDLGLCVWWPHTLNYDNKCRRWTRNIYIYSINYAILWICRRSIPSIKFWWSTNKFSNKLSSTKLEKKANSKEFFFVELIEWNCRIR